MARIALFIVYFWFGLLKVLDLSPATPLANALFNQTLKGFLEFDTFNLFFGLFECAIGLGFLFPRLNKVIFATLALHIVVTSGPLILLPTHTWSGFLIPTMEGQYIIKNILTVAVAFTVYKSRNGK